MTPSVRWIQIALLVHLLMIYCSAAAARGLDLKYAVFIAGPIGSFDSSGVVPAIELAEELINADSSILPGYNLTHTPVADTMCDRTEALNQYFDTIFPPNNPTVLGLLGCGCSVASTAVAEIVHYNSLSQISFSSGSIELNDRKRFPTYFRTSYSNEDLAPGVVTLIQHFGWKRIAFITQEEGLFTVTFDRVSASLHNLDIEVVNRRIPSGIPIRGLEDPNFFFEDQDLRVFFINMYSNIAHQIICEAYQRGYTYPRYVWLTYGWYQDRWWTEEVNSEATNCTDDQLAEFLHRFVALQLLPLLDDTNANTGTGLTPNDFDLLYRKQLNTTEAQANNYTYISFASSAFDALWTLALALNSTSEMVHSLTREEILSTTQCEGIVGELVPLENFSYPNQLMGCIIRWNLERTDFVGVSGPVKFNSVGTRSQPTLNVFQYRHSNTTLSRPIIGLIQRSQVGIMYLPDENDESVFPSSEGGVPSDGTPIININTYHLSLVIVGYVLAAAGLVFTTVCLVFNFTQRNKKVVKLTSPNINYFIILGAYILYGNLFFRLIPSIDLNVNFASCIVSSLTLTIGYCFAYGAILAKMGRIYIIFNSPSSKKKKLKDWKLIVVVLVIAGIGGLFAVLQVAIPELRPTPHLVADVEFGNDTRNEFGVRIEQLAYQCYSFEGIPQPVWLGIIFLYLALLQVIGIVLAIQTSKVKIRLLNDSKFIAALIYTSSIVLVLIIVVTFALRAYLNIGEAITSVGILLVSTLFLALIFIPKMVFLYQDPKGEYVFSTGELTQAPGNTTMEVVLARIPSKLNGMETKLEDPEKAFMNKEFMDLHPITKITKNCPTEICLEKWGTEKDRIAAETLRIILQRKAL